MACFHPITAFRLENGDVSFVERGRVRGSLRIPCGKCIGCRVRRSEEWATRIMHEAQMHAANCFVTLTYDDKHYKPSLDYRDFQLFLKRLRKERGRVRFFCAGEYGEDRSRPHFHALLFGVSFPNDGMVGKQIFRSQNLERLWTMGFSSIGELNRTTASYVAKYVIDKKSPTYDPDYYKRVDLSTGEIVDVVPEFGRMSLKPGIGADWYDRYWRDVYAARDGVVVNGKMVRAPRYYDKRLELREAELSADKEYDRFISAEARKDDESPERLAVREEVKFAEIQFYRNKKL